MKKKRWIVSGEVTISLHTIVTAATAEEAKAEAENRSIMRLCHQCADDSGNTEEWRTSGELDGSANVSSAELLDEDRS